MVQPIFKDPNFWAALLGRHDSSLKIAGKYRLLPPNYFDIHMD